MTDEKVSVFISYAHEDEVGRAEIRKGLETVRSLSVWDDREIEPGMPWDKEISDSLDAADIMLMLLSNDFLNSEYVKEWEIPKALKRQAAQTMTVIPVLLAPCMFEESGLDQNQALPSPGPLGLRWVKTDSELISSAAVLEVTQGVKVAAARVLAARQELFERREIYRVKFLEKFSDLEIDVGERDTLNELRDELELSAAEAEEIEAKQRQPIEEKIRNKALYRKTLVSIIERDVHPLPDGDRQILRERQKDKALTDADIDGLEEEVLAEWQLKRDDAAALAQVKAERLAQKEADRKAKEEAKRLAREEADRLAQEEADGKAKEEAERLALQEADRKAKEEAKRLAREEADRLAQEEAEEARSLTAAETYRQALEDALSDGRISRAERAPLDKQKLALGLSDAEARDIESSERAARRAKNATRRKDKAKAGKAVATALQEAATPLVADHRAKVFVSPSIPERKLQNARDRSRIPKGETVVVLLDCTSFGSAKDHWAFTEYALYYSQGGGQKKFTYDKLRSLDCRPQGKNTVRVADDKLSLLNSGVKTETVISILEAVKHQL